MGGEQPSFQWKFRGMQQGVGRDREGAAAGEATTEPFLPWLSARHHGAIGSAMMAPGAIGPHGALDETTR